MDGSIRREAIMRILNNRRSETFENIACELGVSKRTVQRDISILMQHKPIYTQSGRHGGVFIMEEYSEGKPYINNTERSIMIRMLNYIKETANKEFKIYEIELIESIITSLSSPKHN